MTTYRPMEPTRTEIVEALRLAAATLNEYVAEAGGCDHSVGICMCADIGKAFAVNLMYHRLIGDAPSCDRHGVITDEFCVDCYEEDVRSAHPGAPTVG